MKNSLKVLNLFFLIIVLAGCGISDKDIDSKTNQTANIVPGVPVQWLYFNDEKFVFSRVIPKDEIDMSMVELTGSKTKFGDGVQDNQDIYLYKKDHSLFVISKDGTAEQWANFTKNEKRLK